MNQILLRPPGGTSVASVATENRTVSPLRVGGAFAAFYGELWMVEAVLASQQLWLIVASVVGAVICVTLMAVAGCQSRASSLYPDPFLGIGSTTYVNRVLIIQVIASVVGPGVFAAIGEARFAFPFIVLTVGTFFIALFPVLRTRYHLPCGIALSVIAIASALPAFSKLASPTVLAGVAGGVILLGVAGANLIRAGRIHTHNRASNWGEQS